MVPEFNAGGLPSFLMLLTNLAIAVAAGLITAYIVRENQENSSGGREKLLRFTVATTAGAIILAAASVFLWPSVTADTADGAKVTQTEDPTTPPTEDPTTPPTEGPTTPTTEDPTTPPPPPPDPPLTPQAVPERIELVIDTPSVAAAGGSRVGTTRFQLDDWGDEGPLVQVAPAWTSYLPDGTEHREKSCDIVITVEGPESFGPWYSSWCSYNGWNGFGDAAEDGAASEISLPGSYTITLTDEKSGLSTEVEFEVIE